MLLVPPIVDLLVRTMKNFKIYFLSVLIAAGLFACESQKKVSDIIYDKYNDQPGFSMIALPPNFVDNFVDESEKEQKDLLNQIRDLRLMTFDDDVDGKEGKSVYTDIDKLLDKRGFEELVSINKDGFKITVQVKQNKDIVREMHVLVKGEEKFFIASLIGRIDLNTITEAMNNVDFEDFGELKGFTEGFDFDNLNFHF